MNAILYLYCALFVWMGYEIVAIWRAGRPRKTERSRGATERGHPARSGHATLNAHAAARMAALRKRAPFTRGDSLDVNSPHLEVEDPARVSPTTTRCGRAVRAPIAVDHVLPSKPWPRA